MPKEKSADSQKSRKSAILKPAKKMTQLASFVVYQAKKG